MQLSISAGLLLVLIVFSGCTSNPDNADKQITAFSQTPRFIKLFLDTLYRGNFLIAEKGKPWAGGCIMQTALPSRQFISASLHNNQYELLFWQGGFVDIKKDLVIQYTDTTVTSYAFRDLQKR